MGTTRRLRFSAAVAVAAGFVQPQFRGGVDRVTVDAIILDRDGTPVRDLTLADFQLQVDGKPRRVQSAELVAFDRPSDADALATPDALPEITTNARPQASRLVMLVVDRDSIKPLETMPIIQAGVEFVRRLAPADRVGLLTMPGDGPRVDFTRDHQRVADALMKIVGGAPDQVERPPRVTIREAYDINRSAPGAFQRVYERECRRVRPDEMRDICADEIRRKTRELVLTVPMIAQTKLRTLQTLLEAFGRVEGPKVVVLLSQGIPYGDFLPPEVPDIGRLAARAAIGFYAIQMFRSTSEVTESAQALDLDADRRLMTDSLANMASASGGALVQPTGTVDAAFQQIARELSARYTLSFNVEPQDQDGKPHRIDLQMTRGNARLVRYRHEFSWRPPAPPAATSDAEATLAAVIGSGDIRNELRVQVATFTMPQAQAPGQKTTLWAHLSGVPSAALRLEVFNERDVRVVSSAKTIEAARTAPGAPGDALDYMVAMSLPPGRYVARLAAQDAAGKIGSAEHPFEARLSGTSDLRVGSLMLLDERSVADGHPTPMHSVGDTSTIHAYVELQAPSASAWSKVKGALEIVDPSDGHVRSTIPLALRETGDGVRQIAEAIVSLDGWTAGAYLTRASITNDGATVATVTRTLVVETAHAPSSSVVPTATASGGASAPVSVASIADLVSRGSRYVQQYSDRATSVVAEERYVQIVRRGPADARRRDVDEALDWRDDNWIHGRSFVDAKLRRQMISDMLMVKTRGEMWTNFRDVDSVDGREIKDRSKRALELFTRGDAIDVGATLRRVAEESSRYDLGRVGNINAPTLPLQVLQPPHNGRFDFGSDGTETIDGVETVVLTYRERGQPTFIMNRQKNQPVFISGKLWIVPADGRVLRTEMTLHDELLQLTPNLIVTYAIVPELGMLMPIEMWERYTRDRPLADYVERRARYSNFRRFTVSVSESPIK